MDMQQDKHEEIVKRVTNKSDKCCEDWMVVVKSRGKGMCRVMRKMMVSIS